MPCRIPFQPHMSWADYYFNFIHAKVLLKTRRKVTHNTQPLSQHCPTDRLHTRFSLGIACYSSVNKNLMAARAGLEPAQDCSLLSVQQTDSLPLGLPRHITRDFRQSHNMWSLFASREPLVLLPAIITACNRQQVATLIICFQFRSQLGKVTLKTRISALLLVSIDKVAQMPPLVLRTLFNINKSLGISSNVQID